MAADFDRGEEAQTRADARADADPRPVEVGAAASDSATTPASSPELLVFADDLADLAAVLFLRENRWI